MKFTVGSDVEFFVYNPEGKLVPSQGLLGDDEHGTKHNPLKFDGFTLQRDNVAIEFATPICRNKREFVSAIRDGIKLIMRTIPAGYTIKAVPSVVFTPDQLEHPEAMEFGCDPDFNAWKKGRVNPKPFSLNSGLRTGGLHIHVGHPSLGEKDAKIRMIQYMDLLLGNLSILLDRSPASAVRKELYGPFSWIALLHLLYARNCMENLVHIVPLHTGVSIAHSPTSGPHIPNWWSWPMISQKER